MAFNRMKKTVIGDIIVITALILLSFVPLLFLLKVENASAEVRLDGELIVILPLDVPCEFSPDGGHTLIAVENGCAYIKHSDCPDGVCMDMNGVTEKGGSAVCVPNRVSLSGGEANRGEVDAVVGGH